MAAAKTKFNDDWYKNVTTRPARSKRALDYDKILSSLSAVLPLLVTAKEAAEPLKSNYKTVVDWMAKGHLKSFKMRGRRFTTPEWIAEFIVSESDKNG